jgi:hypothetical protein
MAKPGRTQHPALVPLNRPGEGTSIDIKIESKPWVGGKTMTSIGLDLSTAPVPDRKFAADTAMVLTPHDNVLRLVFGQERFDGKGLRSAIAVQMSRHSAANLIHAVDAITGPSYAEIVQLDKIPIEKLPNSLEEPDQAVSVSANLALSAVSGQEACIDFYEASPFAMGVAARSQRLDVDPVVRVGLRSSLFMALILEIRTRVTKEIEETKPKESK